MNVLENEIYAKYTQIYYLFHVFTSEHQKQNPIRKMKQFSSSQKQILLKELFATKMMLVKMK